MNRHPCPHVPRLIGLKACLIGLQVLFFAGPLFAQASKSSPPATLEQLLKQVRAGWKQESQEFQNREAEFSKQKDRQAKLLKDAKDELAREQKQGENYEKRFDANEVKIARLEETLKIRLGTMGELFGVIRQMAGETRGMLSSSLTSAQLPGRDKLVEPLAQSKGLPSISQLEDLWFVLQQEMIETGKTVRFPSDVVSGSGTTEKRQVVRVGVFNAISNGQYLDWDIRDEVPKLTELSRQPSPRYLEGVKELEEAQKGEWVRFAVDPGKGQLLSLLVQTPTLQERLEFGGVIGYIIIALGLLTGFFGLIRLLYLSVVGFMVKSQQGCQTVKGNNPLGRVLSVYTQNPKIDTQTLEHKLDEAILRESAKLERYLWAVKIISVVAPLLGLLGTVTGMIQTFQAITLYGTGDPKLMAGGISEALVTTMLGLIVAIPLVLLHSLLKSMSRRVTEVLEEQSAGMIAKRREEICSDDAATS